MSETADALPADAAGALRQVLGEDRLLLDPADRWTYGYDNSRGQSLPAAVTMPQDADEVASIVEVCRRFRLPLTTRGRGTGTAGAAVPSEGGIVLSTERMDRIVKIDPANRLAVVQPGVTNTALQTAAGAHGFFWPPDPTSADYCSVGGNLACNAAGPRALKYGTARENTLGLEAVTGAGKRIRTGTSTTKGVVGLDLTRLIVGSEGMLAVITEATVKLTPLPERIATVRAAFTDIGAAARAVSRIMAQPVVPRALEFMDSSAVALVRERTPGGLPAGTGSMLMIEADGLADHLPGSLAALAAAVGNDGLLEWRATTDPSEAKALWAARKALSPALRSIAPVKVNEDVVVPVSEIPALAAALEALADRHRVRIVSFGHAGNGNIHVNLLGTPADRPRLEACLEDVFREVLALKGTLSGEHGIGTEKRRFVSLEIGAEELALMRAVKSVFDPDGILNPGKGLPEPA